MKIRQGEWLNADVGLWDMIRDYRKEEFAKYNEMKEKNPEALNAILAEWEANTIADLVKKEVGSTFYGSP